MAKESPYTPEEELEVLSTIASLGYHVMCAGAVSKGHASWPPGLEEMELTEAGRKRLAQLRKEFEHE